MAPKGMPKDIADRLHGNVVKVLAGPEQKERFNALGRVADGNTPDQLLVLIRDPLAREGQVIRHNNINAEQAPARATARPACAGRSRRLPRLSRR